jgi:hypothetical protein
MSFVSFLRALRAPGVVCLTTALVGCAAGGDAPGVGGTGGAATAGAPGTGGGSAGAPVVSATGGAPVTGGTGGAGGATGGAAGASTGGRIGTSTGGAPGGGTGGATTVCAPSLTPCGSSCVDTMGSQANCGGCGKPCPADQSCWQGACRCATGMMACGGACKDVMGSVANCGRCDNACATGASCVMGVCQCPPGQDACSGACRDLNSDGQHCGKCGNACGAGLSCLYGGCLDPSSVACSPKAEANRTSTAAASISLGKYWLNNNLWGASSGSGTQSIWSTCQQGDLVGWGTSWSWTGTSNQVKSYDSAVFGWHWGWKVTNTGMPVLISSGKKITCGWDFTVTQSGGAMNVAYDIFAHALSNPGTNDDPTDEIMIWLYTAGGAGPIGTKQTAVSLAGTSWNLYRGTITDQTTGQVRWNVFSYVRAANATTAVLNIVDFANDLVSRGWMQSSKYLSSVESGTEVFTGTGQLNTNGYYCRVQ